MMTDYKGFTGAFINKVSNNCAVTRNNCYLPPPPLLFPSLYLNRMKIIINHDK